jgi:class 3 adenylate cyclase
LSTLPSDVWDFSVLAIDIADSTRLTLGQDTSFTTRVIPTVLSEISRVVPGFRGHVLKFTGDGLIAYFPAPTAISKCDLAIQAAEAIKSLVYDALNPELISLGYLQLDIRMGIESGPASVVPLGDQQSKQQMDILGSTVNLACKMQSLAPLGGIVIGETAVQRLHTHWRMNCEQVDEPAGWDYRGLDGEVRRLFLYNTPG